MPLSLPPFKIKRLLDHKYRFGVVLSKSLKTQEVYVTNFEVGDEARVVGRSCEWRDSRGTIVEIINRPCGEGDQLVQECAVIVCGMRRWFMAEHLTKLVPEKWIRLFRAEVIERWNLEADHVSNLDGSCDQLIAVLRDYCDIPTRRATGEVDEFISSFLKARLLASTAAREGAKQVTKSQSTAA